jgi:hypothetical protein
MFSTLFPYITASATSIQPDGDVVDQKIQILTQKTKTQ